MIKCCSALKCHTQVAVLCQFLEETDYVIAFKALQEKQVSFKYEQGQISHSPSKPTDGQNFLKCRDI